MVFHWSLRHPKWSMRTWLSHCWTVACYCKTFGRVLGKWQSTWTPNARFCWINKHHHIVMTPSLMTVFWRCPGKLWKGSCFGYPFNRFLKKLLILVRLSRWPLPYLACKRYWWSNGSRPLLLRQAVQLVVPVMWREFVSLTWAVNQSVMSWIPCQRDLLSVSSEQWPQKRVWFPIFLKIDQDQHCVSFNQIQFVKLGWFLSSFPKTKLVASPP